MNSDYNNYRAQPVRETLPEVSVQTDNQIHNVTIDTGSQTSVISKEAYKKKIEGLQKTSNGIASI